MINLTSISPIGSYLVLAGEPLNESVVRYGPFVTNTEGDMKQAMLNYVAALMVRNQKTQGAERSMAPKYYCNTHP